MDILTSECGKYEKKKFYGESALWVITECRKGCMKTPVKRTASSGAAVGESLEPNGWAE